ncbi:MAG TPA: XdhC family protein [Steroidobacteraceae bacterium]|nr:XdhC family protein [Steroidobacteraceae bacterium]
MNAMDLEVLRTARAWLEAGHRATLCTVVKTWGSSPRPPGSMMVLRDDGQVAGSVSGGCIEDDLVDRLRNGDPAFAKPTLTTYGADAEHGQRFGLPCGGTVQVVLEPLGRADWLPELLAAIESNRGMERSLELGTGSVSLRGSGGEDSVSFDGEQMRRVHAPRPRLLIIGAGQLSRYLAAMAVMLDYSVTVCDPRREYHEGWQAMDGVTVSRQMPDDLVLALRLDEHSAVVALTHDPKLDDLALIEALRTPAFYVGALGSTRSNDARRERLLGFGLTAGQLHKLHGPVGLKLGAKTPPEIAVSIIAEMTALRREA